MDEKYDSKKKKEKAVNVKEPTQKNSTSDKDECNVAQTVEPTSDIKDPLELKYDIKKSNKNK